MGFRLYYTINYFLIPRNYAHHINFHLCSSIKRVSCLIDDSGRKWEIKTWCYGRKTGECLLSIKTVHLDDDCKCDDETLENNLPAKWFLWCHCRRLLEQLLETLRNCHYRGTNYFGFLFFIFCFQTTTIVNFKRVERAGLTLCLRLTFRTSFAENRNGEKASFFLFGKWFCGLFSLSKTAQNLF